VILLHSTPRTTVTCAASGHREDWHPTKPKRGPGSSIHAYRG
jgi:hypothetical protein